MNKVSMRMVQITRTDKDGNETSETRLVPMQMPDQKPRNRAERRAFEAQARRTIKQIQKLAKKGAQKGALLEAADVETGRTANQTADGIPGQESEQ